MKFLITGGNGFLGSNLAKKLLKEKKTVFVMDIKKNRFSIKNKNAKFLKCDLTKMSSLDKIRLKKIDIVFHCAGQPSAALSFKDPIKDLNLNIKTTLNILRWAEKNNVKKFVFASTFNVYEENNYFSQLKETSICKPKSLYAVSKLAAENYVKCICERSSISWNILRMFNIYGPGQDPTNTSLGMINIFLTMAKKSDVLKIKGSTKRFRDFIYIDDVVNAWYKVAMSKKSNNQILNIGTGKKTTIEELLMLISKLLNKKLKVKELAGTPGDFMGCYANINKLRKTTGFIPHFNLKKGLEKFYNWSKKIKWN